VLDKCLHEIGEEPEGMGAYLASGLLSEIVANQTAKLSGGSLNYILFDDQVGLTGLLA